MTSPIVRARIGGSAETGIRLVPPLGALYWRTLRHAPGQVTIETGHRSVAQSILGFVFNRIRI